PRPGGRDAAPARALRPPVPACRAMSLDPAAAWARRRGGDRRRGRRADRGPRPARADLARARRDERPLFRRAPSGGRAGTPPGAPPAPRACLRRVDRCYGKRRTRLTLPAASIAEIATRLARRPR